MGLQTATAVFGLTILTLTASGVLLAKLNVAILGTGNIATHGHAPALLSSEKAQLWSVLSRDLNKAEGFAAKFGAKSDSPAYTSIEKLLQDPNLNAVIVATPDKLHAQHAIAAASMGKHVLLEKPMACERKELISIREACNSSGVVLALGYHLRWHAGHRALVEAVHAGKFGQVQHVRVQWAWRASDATNWRAGKDFGRWWSLGAVGTHCLDLIRWTLMPSSGEVSTARAIISNETWGGPHDETAVVSLKFERGATAEFCSSVLFNSPSRFEIYGTEGWAICEGTLGREGAGKIWTNQGEFTFSSSNPFLGQLNNFADAVLGKQRPEVDCEEGARNVELLLQFIGDK